MRLRTLVTGAFTRRRLTRFADVIRERAARLLKDAGSRFYLPRDVTDDSRRAGAVVDFAATDDQVLASSGDPDVPVVVHRTEITGAAPHSRVGHTRGEELRVESGVEVEIVTIATDGDRSQATGTPVVLEGYAPPGDPRTRTLTVTPVPGGDTHSRPSRPRPASW